jgi:ribosomal protein S18 acetylase RimI-like enzyme
MTGASIHIEEHTGPLADLAGLFQAAMGLQAVERAPGFLALEQARGTRYFVARQDGHDLGLIGLWYDPTGAIAETEPPQIIDLGVRPEYRRQGVASALIRRAVDETRAGGYNRLWLYADGNNLGVVAFYRSAGFRLAAVVPDWYGDGSVKAIFRLDFQP